MSTGTKLVIAALAAVLALGLTVSVYVKLSHPMQARVLCAVHLLTGPEDCS